MLAKFISMKKIYFLSLFILYYLSSQEQTIQFIKHYGDACPDFGLSVDNTSDGGYILLGHTQNFIATGHQMLYLIKVDSAGNQKWQQVLGGNNFDFGQSVKQTTDGGFILFGFTNSFGAGGYDMYLVKTDSAGNLQWQKTYGDTANDYGYSVSQTADGGYILAGSTRSYGSGNLDAALIKTDSAGNQQWAKYFGGTGNDGGYDVSITNDGGYALAGYTYNFGATLDDAMLIKTDSAGNQQWLKHYGGAGNDRALSVMQTIDHGFILGGYTNSSGNGSEDMYLIKIDSSGTQQWDKTFGGALSDKAYSIDITGNNGYVLAGITSSFGAGGSDMYIVKTDTSGNFSWQKTFGGVYDDAGFCIKQTPDLGYVVIGNTISFSPNSWNDILLVKTDTAGNATGISLFDIGSNTEILVYPNPANKFLSIELENNNFPCTNISISNLQGQQLLQTLSQQAKTTIDISSLANGIYFLKVENEKGVAVKKFIKE